MSSGHLKPSYEKIVNDFDSWLSSNIPSLMDKDSLTVVKEIGNKWRSLKTEYINYILEKYTKDIEKLKETKQ